MWEQIRRKMASQDLVLCLDIGGDSIKAAEFSFPPGNTPVLEKFAYVEFSANKAKNEAADAMVTALINMIKTENFE